MKPVLLSSTASRNWLPPGGISISIAGRKFQIPPQAQRVSFAGAKVQLYQALDGRVSLYHGDIRLQQTTSSGG
jgi:hypothetical protein